MKLGRTLAISLLFCAAVWIYLFQHRIDKEVISIIPDEMTRNFSLDANERVTRIEIADPAKKTEIALDFLKGEGWMITAPIAYPADKKTVDGLVSTLRFASKQTRVRADKDWGEYGLDKPQFEVRLVTDQKKKGTLAFGITSPVGKAVYARWTSERGYIFLPPEVKAVFEASVYGLRQKQIFHIPPAEVRKVSVEMGPRAYEWKKEKGKWYWFEPVAKFGKELPADRMDLVLTALSDLYVKEFLEGNKRSKAELGFFIIHDRIRLEGETGEEVFYFGNEVPAQNAYYGMNDKEEMFLVDRVKVYLLLDILRAVENERDLADKLPLKIMAQDSGEGR